MGKIFKQINFPYNIFKKIMEDCDFSDDWHRQMKLLLIFPLTLTYDELEEFSFQTRIPHVELSLSYSYYVWEAQGKHEKMSLNSSINRRDCISIIAFHTKSNSYFF